MNSLVYRDQIRTAKVLLELKLARDVKGSKRDFCKCMVSKSKNKENASPLLRGTRDLVTKDMEKALMPYLHCLFFFFFLFFICSQAS